MSGSGDGAVVREDEAAGKDAGLDDGVPVHPQLCMHARPHPSGPAVQCDGAGDGDNHPRGDPGVQDEDTVILSVQAAWFFRTHWAREALFWTLCVLTAFFLRLLLRWNDDWHAWLRYVRVAADDPRAQHVLLRDSIHRHAIAHISVLDTSNVRAAHLALFLSPSVTSCLCGARAAHLAVLACRCVCVCLRVPRCVLWPPRVYCLCAPSATRGAHAVCVRARRLDSLSMWLCLCVPVLMQLQLSLSLSVCMEVQQGTPTWRRVDTWAGQRALVRDATAALRFDWRNEHFYYERRLRQWTRVNYDTHRPYAELQARGAAQAWTAYTSGDSARAKRAVATRTLTYGGNVLDIQPRPLWLLALDELLKPFFAFQLFSIVVWFAQQYTVYAWTILGMSVFAIGQTAVTTWFNQRALQRLAETETPVLRFVLRAALPLIAPPAPHSHHGPSAPTPPPPPPPIPATERAWSSALLPGDLVVVSAGLTVPCDLVLLAGSCVVNEAMLTGESAPVLKVALPAQADDQHGHQGRRSSSSSSSSSSHFGVGTDRDSKYVLFSGTRVVQARPAAQAPFHVEPLPMTTDPAGATPPTTLWQLGREAATEALRRHLSATRPDLSADALARVVAAYRAQWTGQHRMPVVAMVVRTSFSTAKGQLIRAILFPKPARFDFQRQSYRFILVLLMATAAGCAATAAFSVQSGLSGLEVFKRCLNLITVTIPPALPLALSIGLSAALLRTQEQGVFCTAPPRMTNAGRVNCLCFDKTGTLTEEGLTLHGVASVVPATLPAAAPPATTATARLVVGPMEQRIQPLYRSAAAHPMALALHGATAPPAAPTKRSVVGAADPILTDTLPAADVAAALRLGLVHVLAGCHSLSLLEADAVGPSGALATLPTTAAPAAAAAAAESDLANESSDQLGRTALLGKAERGTYGATPTTGSPTDGLAFAHDHHHDNNHRSKRKKEEEEEGEEGDEDNDAGVGEAAELTGAARARFVGDPLEVQMFLSTGWSFAARPETDEEPTPVPPPPSSATAAATADASASGLLFGGPSSADVLTAPHRGTSLSSRGGGASGAAGDILPPCDDMLTVAALWAWPGLPRHVDTVLLPSHVLLAGPPAARTALALVRRFDFDPALRRMSVLALHVPLAAVHRPTVQHDDVEGEQGLGVRATLLCKGAPESIKDACRPSTVPADFDAMLHKLGVAGFRVLACAVRPLRSATAAVPDTWLQRPRGELETDLLFAGFLVMENRLKRTTAAYLDSYVRAGLRCVMVTGDNPLTAAAVAKRCGPYFVRPSRRTWLLEPSPATPNPTRTMDGDDDANKHENEVADEDDVAARVPSLVLRDLEGELPPIDFAQLLQPRSAAATVPFPPLSSSSSSSAGRGVEDVDLVVTGPAFAALEAHHDAIMAARAAAAAADAAREQAHAPWYAPLQRVAMWRPWTTATTRPFPFLARPSAAPTPAAAGDAKALEAGSAVAAITPLQLVLHRANIFARMSPHNKQALMDALQDLGYVVCMTGDGANDSGALKAADVGISIQASPTPAAEGVAGGGGGGKGRTWAAWVAAWRAELQWDSADAKEGGRKARTAGAAQAAMSAAPSIAAPFSTQLADIGAVRVVLTEGRASLITTFSMFQYMFCYGVIQFTSVLVLYRNALELADYQYLWADLGLVFPLVLTVPLMRAEPRLSRGRPAADLLSPNVWRSVLGLMVVIVCFQVGALCMHVFDYVHRHMSVHAGASLSLSLSLDA
jgi:magnesium-transporting ATPase (P-type)